MRGSSRVLSTFTTGALAAFALIASAEEAASPTSPAASGDRASVTPPSAVSPAAPTPPSPGAARCVAARRGSGAEGTTRLVFETDRPVDFLAVELANGPGLELRLLGANAGPLPSAFDVGDARVRRVTFAAGPKDLVVRVEGTGSPLKSRAFALHDPPRVVVDLQSKDAAAAETPVVETSSASSPRTGTPAAPSVSTTIASGATADSARPDATTAHVASPASPASDEPRFDEFLKWLDEFRSHAQGIGPETPEDEKVRHWRKLAALLFRRGLLDEAERTLTRALESPAQDTTYAFADSLRLAELRMAIGRSKDAVTVAQKLSSFGRSTDEKLRLARVHADGGSPIAARGILEEVLPRVPATKKPGAQLLLARCLWDAGAPEKALTALAAIERGAALSASVEEGSTVLRGDCLFAVGRFAEARAEYERATSYDLSPEESAWVRLQLGNLAHREGRIHDAKSRYKEATEGWPDTFYASQAAWFLQATERLDAIETRVDESGRG